MSNFLACANCHEIVVKSLHEEIKIRAKVILVRDNKTFAVCKGCGDELEVPLKYDTEIVKSLVLTAGPRLYLKK